MIRNLLVALLLLPALLLVGCGEAPKTAAGRTKPKGRILENGLPLKVNAQNLPPGDPGMAITFIRIGGVDAGQQTDAQIIDVADASFELIGADGKGIAPGKYRVAITLAPVGSADLLKGKYSRENSKVEVDVEEGKDLVIDLATFKK
ncbi:MAG: hypothetical protein ACRC33_09065 [Gemmataceae bacterium]